MSVNMRASLTDQGLWFRRFNVHSGGRRRLICFHHAGGGPSLFRDWHRYVTPDTEVWAAAIPGREARFAEPPIEQLDVLAAILTEMLPLDLPFAFFGHSLGSLVGFEVARQLHQRGLIVPQHLFVSASPAPQLCWRTPSRAMLSDADLLRVLGSYNGTPKEIFAYPDYLRMVLPALRADLNLIDSYIVPEDSKVRLPITAYAGTEDAHIQLAQVLAWERWAISGFICHPFEGDHFYLNHHRAELINDLLGRWSNDEALETPEINV